MRIIDQLIVEINRKSSPIVVGLDPEVAYIPDYIKDEAVRNFGPTIKAAAEAICRFNLGLLEEIHPFIPAVKLQMACYELYDADGLDAFRRTVKRAKNLGLIVIDDAKRNDIGHTASIYANGHLGNTPLITGEANIVKPDFLTINPYLGSDTINPFLSVCKAHNKGLFILVRTSNPSAGEYQEAMVQGMPLFQKIAADIEKIGEPLLGEHGFSPVGAVVGATWPEEAAVLRKIMPSAYFLVPGYGAQGGTAGQVINTFNQEGYGALINSSRGIIYAFRDPQFNPKHGDQIHYGKASAQAVLLMRDDLLRSLRQAGKLPKNW
ncbi:MAG: orotidine-5'-phosphate decarboxylase [SAR324 cluster bacterium]|nr:orotidine-5'-phosphate decarboxylase [SAR324 cluster bacterium]